MHHPTLLKVVSLNNVGSSLLNDGSLLSATHLLQQAIFILKQMPLESAKENYEADTSTASFQPTSIAEGAEQRVPAVHHNEASRSTEYKYLYNFDSDIEGGAMFVYTRPIVLFLSNVPPVAKKKQRDHYRWVNAVGSCVFLNLALAYHLYGIKSGASAASQQAMRLYRAVSVMQPRFCKCTSSGSGIVFPMTGALLQCLVLNNLSHVYLEFCNFACSDECLDYLVDVVCGTSCLENHGLLLETEADGIKLNLIFRQQHTNARAA